MNRPSVAGFEVALDTFIVLLLQVMLVDMLDDHVNMSDLKVFKCFDLGVVTSAYLLYSDRPSLASLIRDRISFAPRLIATKEYE